MMLRISADQMTALTRARFCERTWEHLAVRTQHPDMRKMLRDREGCFALWLRLLAEFDHWDERTLAVCLTFALACKMRDIDPIESSRAVLTRDHAKYVMKHCLGQWGVIEPTAFDE